MFKTNDLLESIREKCIVGGVWGNEMGMIGLLDPYKMCHFVELRETKRWTPCTTGFVSPLGPPFLFIRVMFRHVCHWENKRLGCPHKFPRDRAGRLQL